MNVPDTGAIQEMLAPLFCREAAAQVQCVYQVQVLGKPAFHIIINQQEFQVGEGEHPQPSLTFMFKDLQTALDVISHRIKPIDAFMAGQVRTDGNLILALTLHALFRPPTAATPVPGS